MGGILYPMAGWCSWAVPRGYNPGAFHLSGVPVPYGCGCQACGYTHWPGRP